MDIIKDNYDHIITLLQDKKYNELQKIFTGNDNPRYFSFADIFFPLSKYCIINDDEPLWGILILDENFTCVRYIDDDLIYGECKFKLLKFLGNVNVPLDYLDKFWLMINDEVEILKVFISYGFKIGNWYIWNVITRNYTNIPTFLIGSNYDVQNALDNINNLENININTFKLLINNGYHFTNKILEDNIYNAIDNCNIELVEFLMTIYPDYNFKNAYGAIVQDTNMFKYFLVKGMDINDITYQDLTYVRFGVIKLMVDCGYVFDTNILSNLLKSRIYYYSAEQVAYLVELGADITKLDDSEIANMIHENKFDVVKYLVTYKYHEIKTYETSLMECVCIYNKPDILEYLYANGFELSKTLLHIGSTFGYYDIVKMLIGFGMDVTEENLFKVYIIGIYGGGIDTYYKKYKKIPHYKFPNGDLFKLLIDHGGFVDDFKKTMHLEKYMYDLKIIKYFVENGMDINLVSFGATLLENAVYFRLIDTAKYLLDMGAVVNDDFMYMNGSDEIKELFKGYGHIL